MKIKTLILTASIFIAAGCATTQTTPPSEVAKACISPMLPKLKPITVQIDKKTGGFCANKTSFEGLKTLVDTQIKDEIAVREWAKTHCVLKSN